MKRLLLFLILVSPCVAQEQLAASKAQHEQLVKQKRKIIAIAQKLDELRAEQAFAASELETMCKSIVLENRWPSNTQFNYASLGFYVAQPAPPPAPPPPPVAPVLIPPPTPTVVPPAPPAPKP